MKRLRDIEARVVADQMVALTREESVTIPQAVLFVFSQVDELVKLLASRPILVINLMLTTKPMYELFSARIPGLWILLLDQLVDSELGGYAALVYPFFICEQDATVERYKRIEAAFDWPGKIRDELYHRAIKTKKWHIHSGHEWRLSLSHSQGAT